MPEDTSPSQLIDARIEELGDWRGELLGRLRALVKEVDGTFISGFVRATKPATASCCGPSCCHESARHLVVPRSEPSAS